MLKDIIWEGLLELFLNNCKLRSAVQTNILMYHHFGSSSRLWLSPSDERKLVRMSRNNQKSQTRTTKATAWKGLEYTGNAVNFHPSLVKKFTFRRRRCFLIPNEISLVLFSSNCV
uniref:Uncharacterized protein n=1 Tax=Maylandia zebra TaxID=106582 RepID=A0A3P9DFS1_9CICH